MARLIAMTGASGLVGSALTEALRARGSTVRKLVRREPKAADEVRWDPHGERIAPEVFDGVDAVVHLAGKNIGGGRWTEEAKKEILASRVDGTGLIARTLAERGEPKTLVAASAVGFYGDRGDEELDEESPRGDGFVADVVERWEAAADPAREAGIRVVHARFGVILTREGGALERMLTPFRFGVGGRLGSGDQYMAFVSLSDVVSALLRFVEDESLRGVYNVTAPTPATNGELTRALGEALNRPTVLPVPAFALRAAMGKQMADELLLASQRVVPKRLLEAGFEFAHPTIDDVVRAGVEG
jgi:uncharacterized protein (TIGR01777 family)